jgi:probable phosphoglycerate mutase
MVGTAHRTVVIEADGGSRGNPGNAAYGAVLKDADTGEVIAERAERIGVASNNVAEYRGLIAGLQLYGEHADGADLEVRMDSKLVVEQMSGRWKIKHPSMRPLALEANRLAPPGTVYTWVPREQNKHADRLANEALDGPEGVVIDRRGGETGGAGQEALEPSATEGASPLAAETPAVVGSAAPAEAPNRTWALPPRSEESPTTLVLVRHGVTDHTNARRFSGRTGADPALTEEGKAQVRATAEWLAPLAGVAPLVLSSPLRRARESADIVAARLETSFHVEDGLVEAGFGAWEGMTYAEVMKADPQRFSTWFDDVDQPAGGTGDSLSGTAQRVRETRDRLLSAHPGRTVVACTHLTPIKLLTGLVLDLPLTSLFRTEIAPASVTVLAFWPDGRAVVRLLNGRPGLGLDL